MHNSAKKIAADIGNCNLGNNSSDGSDKQYRNHDGDQ